MRRKRWWIIPENVAANTNEGRCSWCGKICRQRENHHIFAKGMGGNKPPGDVRINLIALGSSKTLECPCHTIIHSDARTSPEEKRKIAIGIVAAREGSTFEVIEDALYALKREGKDSTEEMLEEKGLLQWL